MFKALETLVGVSVEVLGAKFISIKANGNNVFQGSRNSAIIQMKEIMAPFFMGMHCYVHRTNLVMFVFSKFSLVVELEVLFQAMYPFFSHSLKKYLEFQKLCEMFMEKGNKMFRNVKTKWISMLSLMQRVMEQY
jgi:hypothetical protein